MLIVLLDIKTVADNDLCYRMEFDGTDPIVSSEWLALGLRYIIKFDGMIVEIYNRSKQFSSNGEMELHLKVVEMTTEEFEQRKKEKEAVVEEMEKRKQEQTDMMKARIASLVSQPSGLVLPQSMVHGI